MAIAAMVLLPTSLMAGVSSEKRIGNGCPEDSGLSENSWVCYTLPEEAARQTKEAKLEAELAVLRGRRPRLLNMWGSAGVSYDPRAGAYDPYLYGGFAIGRVGVWAGVTGSTPALGIGFTF